MKTFTAGQFIEIVRFNAGLFQYIEDFALHNLISLCGNF